jgi:hypothetical protein
MYFNPTRKLPTPVTSVTPSETFAIANLRDGHQVQTDFTPNVNLMSTYSGLADCYVVLLLPRPLHTSENTRTKIW